ncbi:hypothetical protein OPW19_18285 [Vibrio europaeus]|uniref:hypothetical protein n=1 Tax=Vibrio europaeus TaxID=300876 RepID=UPI00233F63C4|nr:hypothetical protein [Vibrio europaeus]MDC5821762.1 hypothetical protein [Vibrio europaeus]MDC5868757.1 hypothetical protein [Vibrio europaeus]
MKFLTTLFFALFLVGCESTANQEKEHEIHVYYGFGSARQEMPRYDKGVTYRLILYIKEPKGSDFDIDKAISMLSRMREWKEPDVERAAKMKQRSELEKPWQIENYDYVIQEGYLVEIYDDDIVTNDGNT